MSKQQDEKYKEILTRAMTVWMVDPFEFIKDMWGITPQPTHPEHTQALQMCIDQQAWDAVRPEWFAEFQRGKHLTWQQTLIVHAVKAAINNKASKRISIASAHGIGKSCSISWIALWFLFCHNLAQIAVTAPTSKQLFDVLWKELSIWINRLDPYWQQYYDWQSNYIRHTSAPQEWFASAKTARRESTEALAGVHGQHVMVIADEASGVHNEIFNTMEGSLTESDILVILISNPTRLNGYFYETHKKPEISRKWQRLQFDNITSPIVREDYNQDIIDKHGKNSDEYRIRVLGQFPQEDTVDDKGYSALLRHDDIKEIDPPRDMRDIPFIGTRIMGIDPAGEGTDETRWIVRDQFKAAVVAKEKISTPTGIAARTRTLMDIYKVKDYNVWVDSFGEGAKASVELSKGGKWINAINVGDACETDSEKNLYTNRRSQNYSRLKKWLRSGGEVIRDKDWSIEVLSNRFRRTTTSKIQMMPKREMRKDGIRSPNTMDALMLTFSEEYTNSEVKTLTRSQRTEQQSTRTILKKTKNNLHSAL